MRNATVVATIDQPISANTLGSIPAAADLIEIRADRAGDLDAAWLHQHTRAPLLYTLRSAREGGASDLGEDERLARLLRAAREYDFVQLESHDLTAPILEAIPAERRVLAWHGCPASPLELAARLAHLSAFDAHLYRIVPRALHPRDELAPLRLLHTARRRNVTAYAEGTSALWTRVVALQLGAPAIFGSVADHVDDDGTPTVAQLIDDYGLPLVDEAAELFAIAGNPVYRSLSPRLHNAAFRLLRRNALYIPFHVVDFSAFWDAILANGALDALGLPMRAMCVVSPYKEVALDAAHSRTNYVQKAASTNFFRRNGEGWIADTTDPEGVLLTLRERGVEPAQQNVAVVGCGGSGRAMAAALASAGATVTLVNRGIERGEFAVSLLRLPFVPLADFSADDFAIVINATPLGRDGESMPFVVDPERRDVVVVDLVYGATPTPLIASARMAGQIAIDGLDVLLAQVRCQFRVMTGEDMPDVSDRIPGMHLHQRRTSERVSRA